ncbi:MAG: hypothetical protein U1F43_13555 [Myxococcota bacterium]
MWRTTTPALIVLAAGLGSTLGSARSARAAPPHEECLKAAPIADFPAAVAGSTLEALHDQGATPCAVGDGYAVWYAFTAPTDGKFSFWIVSDDAPDALVDATLEVLAVCGDETPLACNDDMLHSRDARVDVDLTAGQDVRVRVGGWGATRGDFTLHVDLFAGYDRPPNDACESAALVSQDHMAAGTTLNATGEDVGSCGGEDTIDIWYRFVAPADDEYRFVLSQNMVSAHFVAVFEDCGGAELACGFHEATAALVAGQSVVVRVGSNPAVADTFNLVVARSAPLPPPPNDSHLGAIPVGVPSTTYGTTVGATADNFYWGTDCGPFVNAAVWYSFEAPDEDIYVFDTDGSDIPDTVIGVFGPCDENGAAPPQLLACNDDFGTGQHSRIDGRVAAHAKLCIGVAGHYLSEEGGVRVNVSRLGAPPANDSCDAAVPIAVGDPVFGENFAAVPLAAPGQCPLYSEFALWYAFTAPADGDYKFDTKASVESSPDVALYDHCGAAVPLACSMEPQPSVHLAMTEGQTVLVRLSTDVFWRSRIAVRVGPVRDDAGPVEGDGDAVEEVDEAEPVEAVEAVESVEPADVVEAVDATAEEVDATAEEVDAVEAVDAASEEADAGAESAAEAELVQADAGGCGCGAAGSGASNGLAALLALGGLGALRRRAEATSGSRSR